jgi:hypothetical protein
MPRAGLALLAVMTACAAHFPPCPSAGGPAWTELESAHFRLRTDGPLADARAALTELEQLQAALLTIFGAPSDLDTGRLPVVLVDRGWTDFAPRQVDGFFTSALFQPLIVIIAGGEIGRQYRIKHELVHYLSSKIMPRQLPWLEEGLATYYETIEYDADAGRITVGRPSPGRLRWAQLAGAATIERLFTAKTIDSGDEGIARFYGAAWITVHYLMNHRKEALLAYEKAMRARASPDAAWAVAFGSQTPAQLAADVRRYVNRGQYAMPSYAFPRLQLTVPIERRMSDADAHATRALLYLTGGRMRVYTPEAGPDSADPRYAARRELDEALRQEPAHVRSLAIAHWMLGAPVEFERAEAATRNNAGDWLAWALLSDAYETRHDRAGWDDAVKHLTELARADRSVSIGGWFPTHPGPP